MSNIKEQELLEFIQREIVGKKEIKILPNTLFFKEGIIHSMNILHLIGFIEKKRGRKLSDDEIIMSNFESVQVIVKKFL